MLDVILRTITIVLLLIKSGYWLITSMLARNEKPPNTVDFSVRAEISRITSWIFALIIFFQLSNVFVLLPIPAYSLIMQAVGLFICIVGVIICLVARYELGGNWSHAADYQIKKNHTLITTGIYHYARHPIYLGLALSWIGAEMVAGSWLFISFLALFLVFYFQGKREEENFLRSSFSEKYKDYMKKTKMLIPWIW